MKRLRQVYMYELGKRRIPELKIKHTQVIN